MANKVEKMESIQQEIEAAKKAGFTNQEIKDSYADEINAAKSAGFNDEEINKTYGLLEKEVQQVPLDMLFTINNSITQLLSLTSLKANNGN